jgi:hypothetical protein
MILIFKKCTNNIIILLLCLTIEIFSTELMTDKENIERYQKGGLCLNLDCKIQKEASFIILTKAHEKTVIISRYNKKKSVSLHKFALFSTQLNAVINSNNKEKDSLRQLLNDLDTTCFIFRRKYDPTFFFNPSRYCYLVDSFAGKNRNIFKIGYDILKVSKSAEFWESFLEKNNGHKLETLASACDTLSCGYFNCPVKVINEKIKIDSCAIKVGEYDPKIQYIPCDKEPEDPFISCKDWLKCALEKYDIIFHIGEMTLGDCDLPNWRGIKIKDLPHDLQQEIKKKLNWMN